MAKADDLAEKLHVVETNFAVDRAVTMALKEAKSSWWKTTHFVCVTATSAITTTIYKSCNWLYDHYAPVKIGVDAMIQAILRGDK